MAAPLGREADEPKNKTCVSSSVARSWLSGIAAEQLAQIMTSTGFGGLKPDQVVCAASTCEPRCKSRCIEEL